MCAMPGSTEGWDPDLPEDPRESTIDLPRLLNLPPRPGPLRARRNPAPPADPDTAQPNGQPQPQPQPQPRRRPALPDRALIDQVLPDRGPAGRRPPEPRHGGPPPLAPVPAEPRHGGMPPLTPVPAEQAISAAAQQAISAAARQVGPAPTGTDPALAALAERIRELQALAASPSPPISPADSAAGRDSAAGSDGAAGSDSAAGSATDSAGPTAAPARGAGRTDGAAPQPGEAVGREIVQSGAKDVRARQDEPVSDRHTAEPEAAESGGYAPREDSAADRSPAPQPRAAEYIGSQGYTSGRGHWVMDRASAPADSSGLPQDRPARGSLAELRLRLERLPAGHPSSPYDDQGAPKPSPQQLLQLELPLADEEREADPAARASLLATATATATGDHDDATSGRRTAAGGADEPGLSAAVPALGSADAVAAAAAPSRSEAARSSAAPANAAQSSASQSSAAQSTAAQTGAVPAAEWTAAPDGTDRADASPAPDGGSSSVIPPASTIQPASTTPPTSTAPPASTAPPTRSVPPSGTALPPRPGPMSAPPPLGRTGVPRSPSVPPGADRPFAGPPPANGANSRNGRPAAADLPGPNGTNPYDSASPRDADPFEARTHDSGLYDRGPRDSSPYDPGRAGDEPVAPNGTADRTDSFSQWRRPGDGDGPNGHARGGPAERPAANGHRSAAQAPPTQAPLAQAPLAQAPPTRTPATQDPPTQDSPTQDSPTQDSPTQAAPTQALADRAPADRAPADRAPGDRAPGESRAGLTDEQEGIADAALERHRAADGRNVFGGYGESGLTPVMRRVEAHLPHGQLAPDSNQYTLKTPERYREKLARMIARNPGVPAEDLAAEIYDAARYTFVFEPQEYTDGTWLVHRRLKAQGFELEARRNRWDSPEYRGIRTRWRDPAHDLAFEVQFHTPASWEVLQQTHDAYLRITDPRTPPTERAQLRARQVAATAATRPPPRCNEIGDFRADVR
jgi:hypothetical protein